MTIPELAFGRPHWAVGLRQIDLVKAHFKATEVLSSDTCRGLVSDDENDQVTGTVIGKTFGPDGARYTT
jgi:protein phosphatase